MSTTEPEELQRIWKTPPPGTEIVVEGLVQEGDYFFISELGAWALVPRVGWGEPVLNSVIARRINPDQNPG